MHLGGAKPVDIARELRITQSTVGYTLQVDSKRNEGTSQARLFRSKSYTDAKERLLLRHVRLNLKDTYAEVIRVCGLTCSRSTVKKILKAHGI